MEQHLDLASETRPLAVHCSMTLAANWLGPRISRYAAAHPAAPLRFKISLGEPGIETAGDVQIVTSAQPPCGRNAERLFPSWYTPVCSPALAARMRDPDDLAAAPCFRTASEQLAWEEWSWLAGIAFGRRDAASFEYPALAYNAAKRDHGVALGDVCVAAGELFAGSLAMPSRWVLDSRRSHWLVYRGDGSNREAVDHFRRWILHEAAATYHAIDDLFGRRGILPRPAPAS